MGWTGLTMILALARTISAALYIACKSLIPVGILLVSPRSWQGCILDREVTRARMVETAQSPECLGRIKQVEDALGTRYPI